MEPAPKIYLICAGAGSTLQSEIFYVPGISKILVGAEFPYAMEATNKLLGFKPDHYVSQEVAIGLAQTAYRKALLAGDENPVGLGLTAAVASNREHRGDHQVFVSVVTKTLCTCGHMNISKGVGRDQRMADDHDVTTFAMYMLQQVLSPNLDFFTMGDADYTIMSPADDVHLVHFFNHPYVDELGNRDKLLPDKLLLYPGAFNPFHEGHLISAKSAEHESHGGKVVYTVCINPPHKQRLYIQDLLAKMNHMEGKPVLFTQDDPLYIDKAKKFHNAGIVMGADALIRMLDPKWGPDVMSMLKQFADCGTHFYVANRNVDGHPRFLANIPIPAGYHYLFTPIGGMWDMSSTQLRAQVNAKGKV